MAHITADRVRQLSTSTGTGTFTLSTTFTGFRAFSSVAAVSDTFWYTIASTTLSEWEVGLGTYSAANTITRTTVLASSNAGAAVVFSAGDKEVFITAAASKFLQADAAGSYGNFTAGTITAALTGNASGSAATFTSTSQNSQFNSIGVGVAASSTAGQINAGNIISSGIVTGTSGIKSSDTSFPTYQILLDFGADLTGTWRKIITATLSAGTQYSTHGFRIRITDPNANHATQTSVNVDEVVYYVACVRSETTVVDTPDLCVVRGPAQHVRAVKLATGSYEIQVQPEAQYREYLITIESYATNGAHTIVYSNGSAAGSAGTATYSAAVGGSTTWFDNIVYSGTLTGGTGIVALGTNQFYKDASGNVGIGTTSPGYKFDVQNTYATAWSANTSNPQINILNNSQTANSTSLLLFSSFYSDATYTGVKVGSVATGSYSADFIIANRNVGTFQENLRLTASGNLGLGVTPSAWGSNYKAFESAGNAAAVVAGANVNGVTVSSNTYNNNTNWLYKTTGAAARYSVNTGVHQWFNAPSGTAGAAISFTQAMTLDASGNLGIGTTSPIYKLDVQDPSSALIRARTTTSGNAFLVASTAAGGAAGLELTNAAGSQYIYGGVGSTQNLSFVVGSERMRINSSGNVGIGTTAPASYGAAYTTLAINNTTAGVLDLMANGVSQFRLFGNASENRLQGVTAAAMTFFTNNTEKMRIDSAGNVVIGATSTTYKLQVVGSFAATTKSFVIPHPTKEGKQLRYGSLEGPENGVYVRGRLKDNDTIELPEYWTGLVDEDSITINLTPIGKHQKLYVESIKNNIVIIGNENLLNKSIDCFYIVFAERKDVEKLKVEI
jgi:hypothetical protein